MGFIPPLNLGQFQPSPATLSQWIYQIWQFLQENPIATETEIREFIQSELTQSETLANAIEDYLTENPPPAPVQSVQGKTGAVSLTYPDIVPASNAVPVYKAASAPNASTAQGLYNNGYRLFVNTTTQEVYTISTAGALSIVGRGKFDGTTVDVNTTEGDTTIAEALDDINDKLSRFITAGAVRASTNDGSETIGSTTFYYKDVTFASELSLFPRVVLGIQSNVNISTSIIAYVTNVSRTGFRLLFNNNSGNTYINYAVFGDE